MLQLQNDALLSWVWCCCLEVFSQIRVPGVPDRTGLKSCGPGPDRAGPGPDRAGPGPDTGPGPLLVRFLSSFDSKALKNPNVSP